MSIGIRKALILAGGKGERLRPLTLTTPKPLLDVGGKPILQWNIELARKFGVTEVVLGIGGMTDPLVDFFGNGKKFGIKISYSIEKEFLGTAGALKLAEEHFQREEKFIMMNGDEVKDVQFEKLNGVFEKHRAMGVIGLTPVSDVSQFGSVKLEGDAITAFLEKSQSPANEKGLVNCGAYILSSKVLDGIPTQANVSIEKQVFPMLAQNKTLFGVEATRQWFPTDDLQRLETARKHWKTVF